MGNPDTATAERLNVPAILHNRRLWAGAAAATLVAGGLVAAYRNAGEPQAAGHPTEQEAMPGTSAEVCAPTWDMHGVDHGDQNRWFANGLSDVKADLDAHKPVDAKQALHEWLHGKSGDNAHPGVKNDAKLLSAGYNVISELFGTPGTTSPEGLTDDNGCATDKAVQTVISLDAMFAVSTAHIGEAPASGRNTGTDAKGNVTVAEKPGVSDDRGALVATFPNGKNIYVMFRCGQPVLPPEFTPKLPPGKTDETPRTPETTTTIPMKHDDGELPGDGTPAGKDKGTSGKPGNGPAGQTPGPDGYVPGENRPTAPNTTVTTRPATATTRPVPATTSPQPTSTKPPAPATTSVNTTVPQGGPRPTMP